MLGMKSRVLQTKEVGPFTALAYPGITYTATLRRADTNAVLETQTGLTGTSAAFASTYEGAVIVQLQAVRGSAQSAMHQIAFIKTA